MQDYDGTIAQAQAEARPVPCQSDPAQPITLEAEVEETSPEAERLMSMGVPDFYGWLSSSTGPYINEVYPPW